jgi:lambda family phage portal protein
MPKTKKSSTKALSNELPEELRLRRARARLQLDQVKAQQAMLATYGAADRGRGNRDWRASPASADAAVIPDAATLNARARQCVRDSWIGRSAVRAFSRNVVGCGILPVPLVRQPNGKFNGKVNKRLLKLFWAWASNKDFCDVERRQSFWQKQNLLVEERVTVGESFIAWSYRQNDDPSAVGLRVQSFEAEQLDNRLQSWTDPATNQSRQVRGGVEVDEYGAAVAYHFFTRNPADYLPLGYNSVRIPATRVCHYFKQERVLQVRGVTQLAPVLQEVRDFNRFKQATLWRAIMEACVGGVVTREGAGTGSPLNFGGQAAADGVTAQGKRVIDFTPGMVVDLAPGEKFEPFLPTTPGSQYMPYTESTVNGIGAGIGLSGSQISRQSKSNYSAARQDMLEDRKEFEPEQEMLAHNVLLNFIWQVFVRIAWMEGKLDEVMGADDFIGNEARYCEAEYIAPAAPWIDPKNEADAYEKLINLRVMDREEVAHLRQRRLDDIWDKIASEQEEADNRNILLPEVVELEAKANPPTPPAPKALPGAKDDQGADPKKAALAKRLEMIVGTPPPHYRDSDTIMRCGTCSFIVGTKCTKFNVVVEEDKVCDAWDAAPVKRSDDSGRKILQVPTPEGQAPMDDNFRSGAAH